MPNDCAECRERRRKYSYSAHLRRGDLRRVSVVIPRDDADGFLVEAKRLRDAFMQSAVDSAHHG